jgi:signal transduction histidine kinase
MGVASSPGPDRSHPARRSIRFTFTAMVAVPVLCLVALWGVAVAFTPAGAVVRHGLFSRGHPGLTDVAIFAGGALIVVLLAVMLMGWFARRVSRDISALESSARHLADEQLPHVRNDARDQGQAAQADQGSTRPRTKTAEIARTAAAIEKLRHSAVAAAEHEASMRNGIGQVFVSLSRRNQSLLQKQLRLIDALEQKAADPGALADLFLLDHLTTRMRRHAENLIILSGEPPGRSWSEPVPVIDVLRGAVAEVEDYQRIRVVTVAQDAVTGSAVADMIHLLAELIENAALFSPSGTRVEVRAERVANGFVVEVEDRGLGIQPHLLADINQQLLDPADFALADPDRLGLFVVGKLAARHGVRVALKPSPYGGITAVALMPHEVTVAPAAPGIAGAHAADRGAGGLTALSRGSGDALVLTGRHAGSPAAAETGDAAEQTAATPGSPRSSPGPFSLDTPDSSRSPFTPVPVGDSRSPLDTAPADSSRSPLSQAPADDSRSPFDTAPADSSRSPFDTVPADSSRSPFDPAAADSFRSPLSTVPADGAPSPFSLVPPGGSRGPFDPAPADESRGPFDPVPADRARGPFDPAPPDGSRSPFSLDTARAPSAEPARAEPAGAEPAGAEPPSAQPAGTEPAGTYRGLPRRVRQASLSQFLKNNPAPAAPAAQDAPSPERSGERTPETARDFVASFRTGWRRDNGTGDPEPPPEATGRPDSAEPHGEEL